MLPERATREDREAAGMFIEMLKDDLTSWLELATTDPLICDSSLHRDAELLLAEAERWKAAHL